MKLNIGILATASIVPRFVKGVQLSEHAQVLAITSRTQARAKQMADALNIPKAYDSYEAMLSDPDINLIYITSPHPQHAADIRLALQHERHVLCEKPLTLLPQDAKMLFALAHDQGCFLMEAQKSVFVPLAEQLRNVLSQQVIGPLRVITLTNGYPGHPDPQHWSNNPKTGGGVLYDSACYVLAWLDYLLNTPANKVCATWLNNDQGADTCASFSWITQDNILINAILAKDITLPKEAVFYGMHGTIRVPVFWRAQQAIITQNDGQISEINAPFDNEFVYEIDHVATCVEQGLIESPIMNHRRTLYSIEIVDHMINENHP